MVKSKHFVIQKAFIMTQPRTLLCQQKCMGMVDLKFRVFNFKVVKEKTLQTQPPICILHFGIQITSDIYQTLFKTYLSKQTKKTTCNENKYNADRNKRLGFGSTCSFNK